MSQNAENLSSSSATTPRTCKMLIGADWVDAVSGETFTSENPATGEILAHVAAGDAADVDRAVAAARAALESGPWTTRMSPAVRARLLFRLADLIEANADELAHIESLDNGKPEKSAKRMDIPGAVETLRYNAGWATKLTGTTIPTSAAGRSLVYTVREPVGVVGLIVPWNFPLATAVAKLAPALAAGCTVVLKPAEQTPLSAIRLAELCLEAGIPPGVVNLVTGLGRTVGAAMAAHPGIDKISFTGSTETGKSIVRAAVGNFKRLTLELGGKSPLIVMSDADVEAAATACAHGIFQNSGQICIANSRLYAHKSVFDRVVEKVAATASAFKLGPGTHPETDLGPVISSVQRDRILRYVNEGSGASEVLRGGQSTQGPGYFVEPTILVNPDRSGAAVREEIFGPVLCATPFDDEDLNRIAAEANDSPYGLAAYLWTRDLSVAHKMAAKLKAGSVSINGGGFASSVPFGGYKQSGWGRENGREGIEAFTEIKSVSIAL